MTDRRILQLLPAPLDQDGAPIYRVARYSRGGVTVAPVVAWALVRHQDGDDTYEVVEPVSHDAEGGSMRVGRTEAPLVTGHPVDVVLSPHQEATGVTWSDGTDSAGRAVRYGAIDLDEPRAGPWSETFKDVSQSAPAATTEAG